MPSLKRNFLYNSAYQILLILAPLITTPYVSRVLGPENIGIYVFNYNIASYFALFAMLGLKNYGIRSISKVRDDKRKLSRVFWELYVFQNVLAFSVSLIYIGYVFIFVHEFRIYALISTLYVLTSVIDISWFFFGMENFRITVTRGMTIRILTIVSIFLFVRSPNDLWKYILILATGAFFSQAMLWLFIKNYVYFVRPQLHDIVQHIKPNLYLFLPVIAVSIYKQISKLMLGLMTNMEQVAFYENSERIMYIPYSLITALGTIMLPRMSYLRAKGEQEKSSKYTEYSLTFAMMLSCAMAFGIMGIAPTFVPVFLGPQFMACITLTIAIVPTVIILAWSNVLRTQVLIPSGRDNIYITMTFIGAIVNVLVNLLLIHRYEAMGTVVGTVLAEFAVALYMTINLRKELGVGRNLARNSGFIVAGGIMFAVVRLVSTVFPNALISLFFQMVVGAAIYIVISIVYVYFANRAFFNVLRVVLKKK